MSSLKNLILIVATLIIGVIMGLSLTLVDTQAKSSLSPIAQTLNKMHEHQYQYSLLVKKLEQQEIVAKEYTHSESN